jgi:hypothetical protein
MTRRKYLAEAGLHLYSSDVTVTTPSHLHHLAKTSKTDPALGALLEGCNLYGITRRRKITCDPATLRVSDGHVFGDFRVHGSFEYERFPFSSKERFPDGTTVLASDGGTMVHILGVWGQVNVPAYRWIGECRHSLTKELDLDVLYIGQSWGGKGERHAIHRLVAHTTLQRILADTLELSSDHEILLLLFKCERHRNIISTAGDFSLTPEATDEEESAHFAAVQNAMASRRNRISLAEAALISHFKPSYNFTFKDWKPSKRQRILQELIDLDFSALIVELNTAHINAKLFSDRCPKRDVEAQLLAAGFDPSRVSKEEARELLHEMSHAIYASVPLHSTEERETFLHSMPWTL